MNLSDEIKYVRQKAFLTQAEFAKELHVSFSTVNRWENGKGKPNLSALKSIKQFCEVHDLSYTSLEAEWFNCSSNN